MVGGVNRCHWRMPSAERALLTNGVVGDRQRLAQVIEDHIRRYCAYRRERRLILRLQSTLQRLVAPKVWMAVLQLEDAVKFRDNRVREDLVRWAFRAGVRAQRRRDLDHRRSSA